MNDTTHFGLSNTSVPIIAIVSPVVFVLLVLLIIVLRINRKIICRKTNPRKTNLPKPTELNALVMVKVTVTPGPPENNPLPPTGVNDDRASNSSSTDNIKRSECPFHLDLKTGIQETKIDQATGVCQPV